MLKFIAEGQKNRTDILTELEGIALGYIDENNVFFPNNNMMFRTEWMLEIARFMQVCSANLCTQKQKLIGEIPMECGITAHYKIKDVEW